MLLRNGILELTDSSVILLIEAYNQYTKHHSDLLTLKSLNFLPYDFGRIWAYIFLRLSAKLFVLLGLISGCNESSGISVLSYTTMLPYMSIFECASCLEA